MGEIAPKNEGTVSSRGSYTPYSLTFSAPKN